MSKETVIVTAMILLAAPFATTMAGATADDNATWGLCQADEANEQGDNASNGTVEETPPFSNLSDEDCENAEHPAEDTPDADDNPGDGASDAADEAGDQAPDDTPDQGDGASSGDNPDEDENPGDDQGQP